jgi:hypothetical protein
MAKNNFNDFLLDPDFDDLDNIHLDAERQLYKKGGIKKAPKRMKYGKGGEDEIERVANTNPDGSRVIGKPTPTPPKKKNKPGGKITAPKSTVKNPLVKKVEVKKELKRIDPKKTKRGTGVTYKAAWDADRGGVKSKYKTYAEFKAAAEAWNKKQDAKKNKKSTTTKKKTPASTVSPTERKKLLSKNLFDKIPQGNKL